MKKIAKIAIIHVACPQTFLQRARAIERSAREWVQRARKKHLTPWAYGEQILCGCYFHTRA